MEMTKEAAQKLLALRLDEYPEIKTLVTSPTFKAGLSQVVAFFEIDSALLPIIENEVLVVLCFYAPLQELPRNISESTGLPLNLCESLATMFDALIFSSIYHDLVAFDLLWQKELEKNISVPDANSDLKERLDLRPQETPRPFVPQQPKPLTREELMSALTPKRTMASDIEAMRAKTGGASIVTPPPQGI